MLFYIYIMSLRHVKFAVVMFISIFMHLSKGQYPH